MEKLPTPKGNKILKIVLICSGIALIIATPFIIVALGRKKKTAEFYDLLNLFGQEGKLDSNEVTHLRNLYELKNYNLPPAYQVEWDKYKATILSIIQDFRAGRLTLVNQKLAYISKNINPAVKPDFEKAYKLFIDMVTGLQNISNVAEHKGWLIKASRAFHQGNTFFKDWGYFAPPLMLVAYINTWTGVDKGLVETAAMKDNPIYLMNKKLIFDKGINQNVLKLFDMLWTLTNGKNYFTIDANSVSLK